MMKLLVLFVTLLSFCAARRTQEMLQSTYNISKAVPNPVTGAVYSCMMVQTTAHFGAHGDEWMIGFDTSETPENLRHHLVNYGIPPSSNLFTEGGVLENVQDGDIVYDCSTVLTDRSAAPRVVYPEQAGNDALDLLAMFDDDGSTANGYPYGMPIGSHSGIVWWAIEMHVHHDMFEPDAQVPIKIKVTGTTDAPDEEIEGWFMYGVFTPFTGFPKEVLMNIPVNEDGTHTITAKGLPAAPFCNSQVYPDAVECESCCPTYPFVHLDNPGEFGMEEIGMFLAKIVLNFLHYHHLGVSAQSWITSLDGSETLIDAQFGRENGMHVIDPPLIVTNTDGFKLKATYSRNQTGHHMKRQHTMTPNVIGGYRTEEEMAIGFAAYVSTTPVSRPAPTILYGSFCNTVQNEGYPNENDPMDFLTNIGLSKSMFCLGSCAIDPACP